MKDILENLNNEMFKYFLNKKLFSKEYQYFILELFCNILNYHRKKFYYLIKKFLQQKEKKKQIRELF